jgi:hypothetical protein
MCNFRQHATPVRVELLSIYNPRQNRTPLKVELRLLSIELLLEKMAL